MGKLTSIVVPEAVDIGVDYFGTNSGTNAGVFSIGFLSDGSQIAVGGFQERQFSPIINHIVKYDTNTAPNPDFTFNGNVTSTNVPTTTIIYSVGINSTNQITCVGSFTTYQGATRNRLFRLSSVGIQDTTFATNIGTAFNGTALTIAIDSSDLSVIGGAFTSFNGNAVPRICRLTAAGFLDGTFNTNVGTGPNNNVTDIKIQADGKMLVVGSFTSWNGNTRSGLVRLNTDGTEDATFAANVQTGSGFATAPMTCGLQSDGKILVGGAFTSFQGNTRNKLVRLNTDGTEDSAFYTGMGTAFAGGDVYCVDAGSDGRIYVGGNFTTFNGVARARYARLDSTGADTGYISGNLNQTSSSGYIPRFVNAKRPDGVIYWAAGIV